MILGVVALLFVLIYPGFKKMSHSGKLKNDIVDLNTHKDVIIVKSKDDILFNAESVTLDDLTGKLNPPEDGLADEPILISIETDNFLIADFDKLLSSIIRAKRWDISFKFKSHGDIYYLPMPKLICEGSHQTEDGYHGGLEFSKDINGHISKKVVVTKRLDVPEMTKGKDFIFEGKKVADYSDIIVRLTDDGLLPDKIMIVFTWQEESTIKDLALFLKEMRLLGVKFSSFAEVVSSNPLSGYELKIEPAGHVDAPEEEPRDVE